MKLATLRDGSRDGQLVVVSPEGALAHHAAPRAGTLQQLLDDWNFLSPQLQDLATTLAQGKPRHAFPFDPALAAAPLRRAPTCLFAPSPAAALAPLAGDPLWGASEGLPVSAAPHAPPDGSGFTPQPLLAVVTGDIAQGAGGEAALDAVRLLLAGVAWQAASDERGSPLALQFFPLAVTPDELPAGTVLRLQVLAGGLSAPMPAPQQDGTADLTLAAFAAPLARWLHLRPLRAGAVVALGLAALPWPADANGRLRLVDADGLPVFGEMDLLAPVRA
jgi:fumarylacetoacetate (FAA) hydrolase